MRTGRRDEWGARFACWVWWFEFRFFVVAFLCVCGVWFVHIAVHSFLGFLCNRMGKVEPLAKSEVIVRELCRGTSL